MPTFLTFQNLNSEQIEKYRQTVSKGFPKIILQSAVIDLYWERLEEYFPEVQLYLVDENDQLIGLMNMVPFYWEDSLNNLPDEGWDWMLTKGISDFENKIEPNHLGGLQVIITHENLGKGFSKTIIQEGKKPWNNWD